MPPHDLPLWRESPVLSCFEHASRERDAYEGVCWYRRTFTVPSDWLAYRLVLDFGAVNYRARVWVNGTELGTTVDPFLPFRFEVTPHLRADSPNTLAVEVDNSRHEGDVPGMHVGWRWFGGILRDVHLEAIPLESIADVVVHAHPAAARENIRVSLTIRNERAEARSLEAKGEVVDGAGRTVGALVPSAANTAAGSTTETATSGHVEGPARRSPGPSTTSTAKTPTLRRSRQSSRP